MRPHSLKTEIIAGLTTFLTMSYILIANPKALATAQTGMSPQGVLTATVLVCFVLTLLMGLYAKIPYAIAPGMGVNMMIANLILQKQIPWPIALGMIFWSGVLFLLVSITPLRVWIAKAIPKNLQLAASVGFGLMLSIEGLKQMQILQPSDKDAIFSWQIATPGRSMAIAITTLLIILFLKVWKKSPLAYLIGIIAGTVLSAFFGEITKPSSWFAFPNFTDVFFKLDIWGAWKLSFFPMILSLFFTDFFDSLLTFVGVAQSTNLLDETGNPRAMKQGLIVDALASLFAPLFGSSSGTPYLESIAGIEAGGKTGITAIVTAICFLPCLFLGNVIQLVPMYVLGSVFLLIGFLLINGISQIYWGSIEEGFPSFLVILLIPTTSISIAIFTGFFTHTLLHILSGKWKELSPLLYLLSLFGLIFGFFYLFR